MKMLRQFWLSPALIALSAIAATELPAQAQLNPESASEDTTAITPTSAPTSPTEMAAAPASTGTVPSTPFTALSVIANPTAAAVAVTETLASDEVGPETPGVIASTPSPSLLTQATTAPPRPAPPPPLG
ncbi:MAG: hypothetical protein AAGF75_10190, partial [Cyanobacteria bacterium P01_H01_bin.130]